MGQKSKYLSICLMLTVTGCSTTNLLSGKLKKDVPANNSAIASKNATTSDFSTSTKLKDPVKARLAYASWLEQSENYKEARLAYLKVLEKNSKDAEAILGLARIDRAYGRNEQADEQLKKALKYHPKDPNVLLAIGQVHAERGEWKEALEKMQAAHTLAPYEKMYEFHLAIVEARIGELERAMNHFSRAVGKAEAYYNIGYILGEQGQLEDAEQYLVKALKLKPELKQAETALVALRSENGDSVQPASFSKR